MSRRVKYMGASNRLHSGNLWHNCPIEDIISGDVNGAYMFDDFFEWPTAMATAAVTATIATEPDVKYSVYRDVGVDMTPLATEYTGVVDIAGNDADNDEGIIQYGSHAAAVSTIISNTAADEHKVWFEARLKKASVADNALAFFIGLGEENLTAANTLIDDTGALASKDFLGFQVLLGDGDSIDAVWRLAGQAVANPTVANGSVIAGTDIATMVAATYTKFGFSYNPDEENPNKQIKFFIDNVEMAAYGTATDIAGTLFPDGQEMTPILATKVGATAESKLTIDWWSLATVYD